MTKCAKAQGILKLLRSTPSLGCVLTKKTKMHSLVPLVPEKLQPLEPEPDPEDRVPEDPEPEAAEPVPERESSCSRRSSRSLEVDMASWLDSTASA